MFTERNRNFIILFTPLVLLMIPLIAMQFTSEVQWNISDFMVAAILLYGTTFMITQIFRKIKNKRTLVILITTVICLLLLLWAEMSVGIFGSAIAGS